MQKFIIRYCLVVGSIFAILGIFVVLGTDEPVAPGIFTTLIGGLVAFGALMMTEGIDKFMRVILFFASGVTAWLAVYGITETMPVWVFILLSCIALAWGLVAVMAPNEKDVFERKLDSYLGDTSP